MRADGGNVAQVNSADDETNFTDRMQLDPDKNISGAGELEKSADDKYPQKLTSVGSPQKACVDESIVFATPLGETNRTLSFPSEPVDRDNILAGKVRSYRLLTSINLVFECNSIHSIHINPTV